MALIDHGEINAVSRTVIDFQFAHTAAHGFTVSEVTGYEAIQPSRDSCLGATVFQRIQPRFKYVLAERRRVQTNFNHYSIVTYKSLSVNVGLLKYVRFSEALS